MTDLVNSATWTSALVADDWVAGADAMVSANEQVVASNEALSESTEKVGRNQQVTAQQFNRWLQQIDPASRAQARYNAQYDQYNKFLQAGIPNADEMVRAQRALGNMFANEAGPAIEKNTLAMKGYEYAVGAARAAMAPLLALFTVQEALAFARSVENAEASLYREAQVLDLSTTALQAYQHAAAAAGVSEDVADAAIRRLIRSMDEAKEHAGPQRSAFHDLGVTMNDIATTEGGITATARALSSMKDAGRQASDGVALMSRNFQELRPALAAWGTDLDKLQAKYAKLGYTPEQAKQAAENITKVDEAYSHLQVQAAPAINSIYTQLTNVLQVMNDIAAAEGFWGKFAAFSKIVWSEVHPLDFSQAKWLHPSAGDQQLADWFDPNKFVGPKPTKFLGGLSPFTPAGPAPPPGPDYGQAERDKALVDLKEQVRIHGLSINEQAVENAMIQKSVEIQTGLGYKAEAINRTYAYAIDLSKTHQGALTKEEQSLVRQNVLLGIQSKLHSETMAQYLAQLGEQARLAGLTTTQREDELAIVKAAQIVQKARGDQENQMAQTVEEVNRKQILSAKEIAAIRSDDALKRENALMVSENEQIAQQIVLLTTVRSERDLALAFEKEAYATGEKITAQAAARLVLLQQIGDSSAYADITEQLKQQNELAGMYGDHLEQEQTVQSAILATHHELSDVQADELRAMVAQNQELSKQAQLMSGIQDQFKTFFNSLMHGDLKIGTLVTGILDQYMSKVSDELSSEMMAAIAPQKSISAGGPGVKSPQELADTAAILAQSDSEVSHSTANILLAAQSGTHPLHVTMDNLPPGTRGSLDTGGDAGGTIAGGGDLGSGLVGQQASGDYYNAFGDNLGKFTADTEAAMTAGGTNVANDITSAFDTSGTGFVADLGKVFSDGASLFGDLFSALLGGGGSGGSSLGKFLGMVLGNITGVSLGGGGGGNFTPMDVTPGPMDLTNPVPSVAYAGGGSVTGPGGPTDDAIAARLSAGEFVVNADAAQQNAGLLNALNSGARPANDNRGSTVINISIDARGAQQGVGQEIATKLEPMIRAIAAQESARREPQTIMRSVAAAKSSAHVRGAK